MRNGLMVLSCGRQTGRSNPAPGRQGERRTARNLTIIRLQRGWWKNDSHFCWRW